jgi:hypothetical protein
MNCFIQKQDTVAIPPLVDAQLQNAAFSVIEAAKSQLAELKLADLYAQQLQGDRYTQFISEFLYHWAGVDSKPPDAMVESCKQSLHSMVQEHVSLHESEPQTLVEVICPLLPYLSSVADADEVSAILTRIVHSASEESADLKGLATLRSALSEMSFDDSDLGESNEAYEQLQAQKLREIQRAFELCLSGSRPLEGDFPPSSQWTGGAFLGSETTPTIQTHGSDDAESCPLGLGPLVDQSNDEGGEQSESIESEATVPDP